MRKTYGVLSSSLTNSNQAGDKILLAIIKLLKSEMKKICSVSHDSILRDGYEGVKLFSWETVWQELMSNMPTLMAILTELVPQDKPVVCLVASMLLKKRLPKMGLVQRAVSLLLYGNGTNKQVHM